ncbi:hypothetical protein D3C78_1405830 [compost metagenome]
MHRKALFEPFVDFCCSFFEKRLDLLTLLHLHALNDLGRKQVVFQICDDQRAIIVDFDLDGPGIGRFLSGWTRCAPLARSIQPFTIGKAGPWQARVNVSATFAHG